MRSRREFIGDAGFTAAGLLGVRVAVPSWISPVHAQSKSSAPFRVLRARPQAKFTGSEEKPATSLVGYDGTIPGPVLRAKQGDELGLRLFNELDEPTSVHWHGVRLPNGMDGVPDLTQPPLMPGTRFDYRFAPPDAGTFWYHAHSPEQVDRGLYGALIVEERQPVDVDRDVALVLGMPDPAQPHPREHVLVNGAARPDIPVQSGERLRLRLVNATSARGMTLKVEGHAPWVMAIDGQPVEPFLPRDSRVGLAPGGRIDLFLDMTASPGANAQLLSGDNYALARLVCDTAVKSARAPREGQPLPLPGNRLPAAIDLGKALRADFRVSADAKPSRGNGGNAPGANTTSLGTTPLFAVSRGRPVSLALHNDSGQPHVVHVHGHHFRLLDRLDDGWKPYWLDTLVVGEQVERIAFAAGNPGKWLIESRMLDRAAGGTAAWFLVT